MGSTGGTVRLFTSRHYSEPDNDIEHTDTYQPVIMMVKIVDHLDHLVQGLAIDMEKKKQESAARQRLETQLYRLLTEMVETERKYVRDLEQACDEYLPLAGKSDRKSDRVKHHSQSLSLDRKKRKKRRNDSGTKQRLSGTSRGSLSGGSRSSQGSSINLSTSFCDPAVSWDVSQVEVKMMLGNIEELRDYHKHVMLPKMETAVDNAAIMRQLFEGEQSRLSRKYGRYCINNSRSSIIVDQNIKFFSSYQFSNHLELRIDAMLIKPIQRLTRYQLFLSSISKTCQDLGYKEAGAEFNLALESVLSAAGHTNTMMWIGKMVNCPIDLPSQGQLIKHGKVTKRPILRSLTSSSTGVLARRFSSPKTVSCQLFLFQKTVMLCKTTENLSEPHNPHLLYDCHISMNQIRVRDVIADDDTTFEVHKLEHIKDKKSGEAGSGLMMRLQCRDEEEKNHWVRCINTEVKLLRNTTKNISSQTFIL